MDDTLPAARADVPAPPTPVPPRGVYLRRHHARVIEDGNLLVVEFLDNERRPRGSGPDVRPRVWQAAGTWGAALFDLIRQMTLRR